MARKKTEGGKYSITVRHGSDERSASGDDLAELLVGLGFQGVKAKVVLTVSAGGRRFERVYLPRLARRFLGTKVYAEAFARSITRSVGE